MLKLTKLTKKINKMLHQILNDEEVRKELMKKGEMKPEESKVIFTKMASDKLVNECFDLAVRGYTNQKLIQFLRNERGQTAAQANVTIKNMNEAFLPAFKADQEVMKNKFATMFLDLYERALADKQYKTSNQILLNMCKLYGVMKEQDIVVTTNNQYNIKF